MYHTRKSVFFRLILLILAIAMVIPTGASAAVLEPAQPRASYYLNSYSAYIYPAGGGKIQIYFSAVGTNYMDELGALSISLYESTDGINWTWKKTFTHDSTSGMLSYDDSYHSGHVDYQGVAGRYYKAYVCIWGGKNGAGDTRYFWTSAKIAT